MQDRCNDYYGVAIDKFLRRLVTERSNDPDEVRLWLNERMDEYLRATDSKTGIEHRVAMKFAFVYAAGCLAIAFKVLPWTRDDVRWAVKMCHAAHLGLMERTDPQKALIASIAAYCRENAARFIDLNKGLPELQGHEFNECPGFLHKRPKNGMEVLVPPAVFMKHFDPGFAIPVLVDHGLAFTDAEKYQVKRYVRLDPQTEARVRERVYCLSGRILEK